MGNEAVIKLLCSVPSTDKHFLFLVIDSVFFCTGFVQFIAGFYDLLPCEVLRGEHLSFTVSFQELKVFTFINKSVFVCLNDYFILK